MKSCSSYGLPVFFVTWIMFCQIMCRAWQKCEFPGKKLAFSTDFPLCLRYFFIWNIKMSLQMVKLARKELPRLPIIPTVMMCLYPLLTHVHCTLTNNLWNFFLSQKFHILAPTNSSIFYFFVLFYDRVLMAGPIAMNVLYARRESILWRRSQQMVNHSTRRVWDVQNVKKF